MRCRDTPPGGIVKYFLLGVVGCLRQGLFYYSVIITLDSRNTRQFRQQVLYWYGEDNRCRV